MAATREDISGWYDQAVADNATHMLVVCDEFDHGDYPVFVHAGEDVREIADGFDGKNMQRVIEVYALHLDKDAQMSEWRARHYETAG